MFGEAESESNEVGSISKGAGPGPEAVVEGATAVALEPIFCVVVG